MPDLWSDLVSCLDLDAVPATDAADALFEGRNLNLAYHRVFGGQLLAQFARAAAAAVPDKAIKSLHAIFVREGNAGEPIRYRVHRHHAGRSFATVSVVAEQSKGVVATASVSLHAEEPGPDRQTVAAVPALLSAEHKAQWDLLPWETRTAVDLEDSGSAAPEFEFWMRTPAADPALAPALAAYATDLTLIGTALLPQQGYTQSGNGTAFFSAVTTHTLWFHRAFRTDDWLLLRQHSPILAHARAYGRGDILTENGTLVASYAQEAMVRLPQE
ncbi:acyl-CoA thioesterase [Nocardia blacklockiae]|uniref:acyl-CoA thioesterase n=1 Tax=Nocardia blacklockiae TaxID=480036 RepID=UPI001894671C|nr:acyl-CoA thioesterase domain-containing protein [Nocardia blacklockiae]MBF6170097.1 thioesterase family protein [Nocardia blacklockiae]